MYLIIIMTIQTKGTIIKMPYELFDYKEVKQIEDKVLSILNIKRKKSDNYFIEEVARYLWDKWKENPIQENSDNFVLYICPLIRGVMFKHRVLQHGLDYETLFQTAIIRVLQSMYRYNPDLTVRVNGDGSEEKAKIFAYFSMSIGFAISLINFQYGAEKVSYHDYNEELHQLDFSNAAQVYQEFILFLEGLMRGILPDNHRAVYEALLFLMNDPTQHHLIANHLVITLKAMTNLHTREVNEALYWLRKSYGPLILRKHEQDIENI
jgi:hypothetical protein